MESMWSEFMEHTLFETLKRDFKCGSTWTDNYLKYLNENHSVSNIDQKHYPTLL